MNKLVIVKDEGVHSMISIPGSLSFAKLMMMPSTPAKSAGLPDRQTENSERQCRINMITWSFLPYAVNVTLDLTNDAVTPVWCNRKCLLGPGKGAYPPP